MDNKNQNNLDDLIGSTTQPIIVKEEGSDKKFLYILIIILVVLFLIALGVIAFISGKYFGSSNRAEVPNGVTPATNQVVPANSVAQNQSMAPAPTQKSVVNSMPQKSIATPQKVEDDTAELEKLLEEQEQPKVKEAPKKVQTTMEQNTIAKVASTATGGKTLSQEELAKIAKLVALELAKSKAINRGSAPANKDEALIASLQEAQTDTLTNQNINTQNLRDTKVNSSSSKRVDTFNKVIVKEQANEDDEIAKLSAEIDSILQSDEVATKEKSLKYAKELNQEIKSREREMRFIVVKPGDTLSSLAYKAYGRASAYKKIYEANPDLIKNPNKIYVGMRLRVPVDEEYIKQQGN